MSTVPEGYFKTHCCACQYEFHIRPSMAMLCGHNSGHASCPKCKEFLHIEVLEGNEAMTERFSDYLKRMNGAPTE